MFTLCMYCLATSATNPTNTNNKQLEVLELPEERMLFNSHLPQSLSHRVVGQLVCQIGGLLFILSIDEVDQLNKLID